VLHLYKSGKEFAIRTDLAEEDEFIQKFSGLLEQAVVSGKYNGDLQFQFVGWLSNFIEIICKIRGYKAEVTSKTVMMAGPRNWGISPEFSALDPGDVGYQPPATSVVSTPSTPLVADSPSVEVAAQRVLLSVLSKQPEHEIRIDNDLRLAAFGELVRDGAPAEFRNRVVRTLSSPEWLNTIKSITMSDGIVKLLPVSVEK
jgi:hypothetical protein